MLIERDMDGVDTRPIKTSYSATAGTSLVILEDVKVRRLRITLSFKPPKRVHASVEPVVCKSSTSGMCIAHACVSPMPQ